MLSAYTDTSATISKDIILSSFFDEVGKADDSRIFWQATAAFSESRFTTGITIEGITASSGVEKKLEISGFSTQKTSALRELNFDKEIESGITQKFSDAQQQLPAFPFYEEEDILNLDAVIFTPPPLESGTIRVKLIYEEPSKPIPVEDPWEE